MKSMLKLIVILALIASLPTYAATIAHWDFEDGVAGQAFTPAGEPDGSGGSVDNVNGYLMRGWNDYYGPGYTADTPTGEGLAMRNLDNHQDGYSFDDDLLGWAPEAWTIELSVKMFNGVDEQWWCTFIGRDGSADPGVDLESVFYLQKTWDNYFRINFRTDSGERYIATSQIQMQADKWYSIAAQSDGSTLSLWVNDYSEAGWALVAEQAMGENYNGMAWLAANWTFGRGWFNDGFGDHINGVIDDVRFSDEALTPDQFITYDAVVPEPATLALLGFGALSLLRKRK